MDWKKLLESSAELANDELRLRHEYLLAENRILRHQIDGRVKLTDNERRELAEIGAKLGKQALAEMATVAQADTILAWNRKFANQAVNSSAPPQSVGRPRVDQETEEWVIRMARENRSWGYDRIQGALQHLGYTISDQTVGNILKRHHIPPAPERKKTVTWREFIRSHWDVLVATDFFNSEVWSGLRLTMFYLLSCLHFSRHQVVSIMTALHQQMLDMQSLVGRSRDLSLLRHRREPLCGQCSRSRQAGETELWRIGPELAVADVPQKSEEMGTVVVRFDISTKLIRDGPSGRHPSRGDFLNDPDRKAA